MNGKYLSLTAVSLMSALGALAQEPADSLPGDEMLDEIVVTATRPVITSTADKTVYDASVDPDAKAMTLLDLLRKVPGVVVDAQDNVTLNGAGSFKVQVDGRDNPMFNQDAGKIFKSIPASMVQRVEVINAPGASYDAEGVGGVINIVMKSAGENMDGYSVTFTGDGGTNSAGGNIYGMMQKGRLGLTLSVNGNHGSMPEMVMDMMRGQAEGPEQLLAGRMKNTFNFINTRLDASIALTDADKLTLSAGWNGNNWTARYRAATYMGVGELPFLYDMVNNSKGHTNFFNAGVDYTHLFTADARHKLHAAYQFSTQPTDNDNEVSYYADGQTALPLPDAAASHNHSNMPEHIAQVDYAQPIGEMQLVETGVKLTRRNADSEALELDYTHNTTIAAAYASYALTLEKFNTKAGLRYEYTGQHARFHKGNGEDFKANYSNLVPSLTAGWNLTPVSSLSASYSMRLSRPGINYLNPYFDDTNPLAVQQGNPYLKPERYNSIAAAYNGMYGSLMLSARLDYTFCNDGLTPVISLLNNNVQYTTYANSLHKKQVNMQLFANYRLGTKTTLMANITPMYQNLRTPDYRNHGWQLTAFCGLQQKLPWQLNLGVNIFASTPQVTLQGRGMSQFIHVITLGRAFLKEDRLNVTLTALDPFYGRLNLHQWERGRDFYTRTTGHMNLRMVQVSVSYRLGSLKSRIDQRTLLDSDAVDASSGSQSAAPSIAM